MTSCGDKVAYLSEYLARNAATLHTFLHPACDDVRAYQCPSSGGEHWHIGHQHRECGTACKAGLRSHRPPNTFKNKPRAGKKPRPRGAA